MGFVFKVWLWATFVSFFFCLFENLQFLNFLFLLLRMQYWMHYGFLHPPICYTIWMLKIYFEIPKKKKIWCFISGFKFQAIFIRRYSMFNVQRSNLIFNLATWYSLINSSNVQRVQRLYTCFLISKMNAFSVSNSLKFPFAKTVCNLFSFISTKLRVSYIQTTVGLISWNICPIIFLPCDKYFEMIFCI